MKNKKLLTFNIVIVFVLFIVIFIGNQTWGTNHASINQTEVAKADDESKVKENRKKPTQEKISKELQLVHKEFKEKKQTDFDAFNHDVLEIIEMEAASSDEEDENNELEEVDQEESLDDIETTSDEHHNQTNVQQPSPTQQVDRPTTSTQNKPTSTKKPTQKKDSTNKDSNQDKGETEGHKQADDTSSDKPKDEPEESVEEKEPEDDNEKDTEE